MAPQMAVAQRPTAPAPSVGSRITLDDAISIAKRSNPQFLTSVNARRTAAAQVRTSNGAFLPSLNSSFSGDYREGRPQIISGQTFGESNSTISTSGGVNASYSVTARQFSDRKAALANQDATEADIGSAEQTLRANVVTQYIAVLQAQAQAVLQDTLLVTTGRSSTWPRRSCRSVRVSSSMSNRPKSHTVSSALLPCVRTTRSTLRRSRCSSRWALSLRCPLSWRHCPRCRCRRSHSSRS
jgi:hypothetical protein